MSILEPPLLRTLGTRRRYERLIAALSESPCAREELDAKIFCLKTASIAMLAKVMTPPHREVRICKWLRTSGQFCPVYALGTKEDAPKLKKRTAKQRHYDIKANAELHGKRLATALEKKRIERAQKYPGLLDDMVLYVRLMNRCCTKDAASHFRIAVSTAAATLRELEESKQVMRISDKESRGIIWAAYIEPSARNGMGTVQRFARRWRAPKVEKQGIFAALGL
ncbi:hypothetical protein [Massilia sp. PWRC2]|uniref:hypothetical protein n=1 Tax=Massilia sp. PWRC2 TaxID=2804626 RepID=UPI003CEED646